MMVKANRSRLCLALAIALAIRRSPPLRHGRVVGQAVVCPTGSQMGKGRGMVGGYPHARGQTLCSNVRVFWRYHPPSGFKNDRCSPMCEQVISVLTPNTDNT